MLKFFFQKKAKNIPRLALKPPIQKKMGRLGCLDQPFLSHIA